MQSAESPGCYWILPKDHGETDRSLCPNYFWRLKLVETVLMTVDCIGSHQVYPWKIHETSIVGVCKVRNPAGTLVPFFRPRSIGSRNLFDLKHTHIYRNVGSFKNQDAKSGKPCFAEDFPSNQHAFTVNDWTIGWLACFDDRQGVGWWRLSLSQQPFLEFGRFGAFLHWSDPKVMGKLCVIWI